MQLNNYSWVARLWKITFGWHMLCKIPFYIIIRLLMKLKVYFADIFFLHTFTSSTSAVIAHQLSFKPSLCFTFPLCLPHSWPTPLSPLSFSPTQPLAQFYPWSPSLSLLPSLLHCSPHTSISFCKRKSRLWAAQSHLNQLCKGLIPFITTFKDLH